MANPTRPRASAYETLNAAIEGLNRASGSSSDRPLAWAEFLEGAVRVLVETFQRYRELAEAPGGVLEQIAATKPHLMRHIDWQRREHVECLATATRLAAEIAEQRAFERISVDRFRLEAGILCDSMRLHLARAADLLYEAEYVVEGGEGG